MAETFRRAPELVTPEWARWFRDVQQSIVSLQHGPYVPIQGAAADGVTDDTAVIQAALDAIGPTYGGIVVLPQGPCAVTSLKIRRHHTHLLGLGRYASQLIPLDPTANVIEVQGVHQAQLESFAIAGSGQTGGAGVCLQAAGSAVCANAVLRDLFLVAQYYAIQMTAAAYCSIETCELTNFVQSGVWVANSVIADLGDSTIVNCQFSVGSPALGLLAAVYQESSGLLRIKNCKMLGGVSAYYGQMTPTAGASWGLPMIEGCNLENMTGPYIRLARDPGSIDLAGNLMLVGNHFGVGLSPGVGVYIIDIEPDAVPWVLGGVISGNDLAMNPGINGLRIGAASAILIGDNRLSGGAGATAITIGADSVNCQVNPNFYDGWDTNVDNSSGSTLVSPWPP